MAEDGLSVDFQGVEGHGEAQIFRPSQTVGQFDQYMREASQDLQKRKEQSAMDAATLGQVKTDKIWEKDQDYFIGATQGLLKQTADFYKKYENNPKLVNSEQYFRDKLALQKIQSEIDYQAQGSAQSKELYTKHLDKVNSDTDIYDNPKNTAQLSTILAEKDMSKRGEMLRNFRPHKNWDLNKSLDQAAKSIGDFVVSKETGTTTRETKNARFQADGKTPTEYGLLEAEGIKQFLDTKDGARAIEALIEQKGADNFGTTPEEITKNAGLEVAKMIMSRKDQELKISMDEPRAASAEDKKFQSAVAVPGKEISFNVPVVKGSAIGQEGDIVKKAVDKKGNTLEVEQQKDGTFKYYDAEGKEVLKGDVVTENVTQKVTAKAVDGGAWPTAIQTTYTAPWHIEMDGSGVAQKTSGPADYLLSGYYKMNYVTGKDGKVTVLSEKALPGREKKGDVKQGWFALGSLKAAAGSDQVANDKPRFIPLTKELYQMNQKNVDYSVPEDELWGSSNQSSGSSNELSIEEKRKLIASVKLSPGEKAGITKDGRVAIYKDGKFVRYGN